MASSWIEFLKMHVKPLFTFSNVASKVLALKVPCKKPVKEVVNANDFHGPADCLDFVAPWGVAIMALQPRLGLLSERWTRISRGNSRDFAPDR